MEFALLGGNYRLKRFQTAVLIAQLAKLSEQTQTSRVKVAHLCGLMQFIKGLRIGKENPRGTFNPYDLITLRHELEYFDGLGRDLFLRALASEGIPAVRM